MSVQSSRIKPLNDKNFKKGKYVLYWMEQSQRAEYNHALEYAIELANHLNISVIVIFCLTFDNPEVNQRHFMFTLEGLKEVVDSLALRGIKMIIRICDPEDIVKSLGSNASAIICDRGYRRLQKKWRRKLTETVNCRVEQVESDVVVPVGTVSDHAEHGARTIRPKINRHLDYFLTEFKNVQLKEKFIGKDISGLDIKEPEMVLKKMASVPSIPIVTSFFKGGTSQAKKLFNSFIDKNLINYVKNRNNPGTDDISYMNIYLHYGQISPIYIALKIMELDKSYQEAKEFFLEELIVRREFAINFVNYTNWYDSYRCLPEWCQQTLETHKKDTRKHLYTKKQLESASTHDEYWNAAMNEIKYTGFMHKYMRMYWAKKILEWSKDPEVAFNTALAIYNRYALDGNDADSYMGIAWAFGFQDRPWQERPIYGMIRYMSDTGLKRKTDIDGYVKRVRTIIERIGESSKGL